MKILVFYVPPRHAEKVKDAVFGAGGGSIGAYERCSWQCLGWGQFKPLESSKPFIGRKGSLARVRELRVEVAIPDERVEACVSALIAAHPYETPAWHVLACEEPVSRADR